MNNPTDNKPGLVECLSGPHEWGYRDPVVGGFISDDTPFHAADTLSEALRVVREARLALGDIRKDAELRVADAKDILDAFISQHEGEAK